MPWEMQSTRRYERVSAEYRQKHPGLADAIFANLNIYFSDLCALDNPLKIHRGFIHPEFRGLVALRQRVRGKTSLRESRLYVYPETGTKCLHLITIGNKDEQKQDLVFCRKFLDSLQIS